MVGPSNSARDVPSAPRTLVRAATERSKTDAQRLPEFAPARLNDPRLRALMAKVEVVLDQAIDAEFPSAFRLVTEKSGRPHGMIPE